MVKEALGQTSDESEYVYLSDGGHFENLGSTRWCGGAAGTSSSSTAAATPTSTTTTSATPSARSGSTSGSPSSSRTSSACARCGRVRRRCAVGTHPLLRRGRSRHRRAAGLRQADAARQRGPRRRQLRRGPPDVPAPDDRRPVVQRVPDRELPLARAAHGGRDVSRVGRRKHCRLHAGTSRQRTWAPDLPTRQFRDLLGCAGRARAIEPTRAAMN